MSSKKQQRRKPYNLRGYISWSQLSLYRINKDKYIEEYVYGKKQRDYQNAYMSYGSKLADHLETGEGGTEEMDMIASLIPQREHMEYIEKIDMPTAGGPITLHVAIDSYGEEKGTHYIEEYKTGKTAWTQKRANSHDQLTFYALGIWYKTGKIPKTALHWIPTENRNGTVMAVGAPETFHVEKTMKDLLSLAAEITAMVDYITPYYQSYINEIL